jgi:hypothetical protein
MTLLFLVAQVLIAVNIVFGALNVGIYAVLWWRWRSGVYAALTLAPLLIVLVAAVWLAFLDDGALGPVLVSLEGLRLFVALGMLACNVLYMALAIRQRIFP